MRTGLLHPSSHEQRHTTRARAQFAVEFAAAVHAISKLDQKRPAWYSAAPNASAAPRHLVDLNGRETTHQIAFKPYEATTCFGVSTQHRKGRDDFTDYCEALFMQRNLFGKKGQ